MGATGSDAQPPSVDAPIAKMKCGIVMPISSIDGCSEIHWSEVLNIITEAIEDSGFEGNLVSNADDAGIIQKRIIQNLYENPVVVCDVSGKNPNVMFELGMRLAFDKPTIIIKDDETTYSFDTSPIEHLEYPRDLRFSKIVDFKSRLAEKIKATYLKSTTDKNYTTFLKHFGEFKVAVIDKKEVSGQEFIIDELKFIRHSIRKLEQSNSLRDHRMADFEDIENQFDVEVGVGQINFSVIKKGLEELRAHPAVVNAWFDIKNERVKSVKVKLRHENSRLEILAFIDRLFGSSDSEKNLNKHKLTGL